MPFLGESFPPDKRLMVLGEEPRDDDSGTLTDDPLILGDCLPLDAGTGIGELEEALLGAGGGGCRGGGD